MGARGSTGGGSGTDEDVQVKEGGSDVGLPRNINFSDVNDFLITEDIGNDEIDIAINRNVANGIAGLDGSGILSLSVYPTGTGLQVLRRNAGNTALEFVTLAGGGDMVLADPQTVSGAKTFLDTTMLLRNVANTFNGSFVNTNTVDRIYTLQDAAGTLAFLSDISDQDVQVREASVNVGSPRRLNFSDANDFLITEDIGNDEIDIAINRNVANGIAGLNGAGLVPLAQLGGITTTQLSSSAGILLSQIEAISFSKGGTIIDSPTATVNIIIWRAPFACTVTNVRGYVVGGASSTINARKNGSLNHLASALTVTPVDTWVDGGAVSNTAYVAGDKLEIMIVTIVNAPSQIAVQVDFDRP